MKFYSNSKFSICIIISLGLLLTNCKDDEMDSNLGTLKGTVTAAADGSVLADAIIIVFNSNTNAPTGTSLTSGGDGTFSTEIEAGTYFIKVSKQGYQSVPPTGITAVPFTVTAGMEVDVPVEMFESTVTGGGWISGTATDGANPLAGVLVVATSTGGTEAFSSVTDENGDYTIFNVVAGSYSVSGFLAEYNSDSPAASVTTDTETPSIDLTLTTGATGQFTGQVRHLSADNKEVDVALIHPLTRETIPGLITETASLAFTISNIPDGLYIARATFENDERVMDPDRIFKFGEPEVDIVGGGTVDLQIDVTGSVLVVSPTNEATTTQPLEITSTTPTFEWTAFASTSDYVIEVADANGNVIWGGFDTSGTDPVKNIEIPSSQLMIDYNSDGNASLPALEAGRIYRWRIFASKNDVNSPTGWTLISASEDQLGLIKIAE